VTFASFQEQMDRLAGLRFRPTSLQTHWEALHDLDEDALTRAITWGQKRWPEFPSPEQVLHAVELSVLVVTGFDDYRADRYCSCCADTGWRQAEVTDGQATVERCVCWTTNPVLLQRRARAAQQATRRQSTVKASA
jgi:hypothetical protein